MKITHVTGQHILSGIGRYGFELSQALVESQVCDLFLKPGKKGHPDSSFHTYPWIKPYSYKSFRSLHPYILPYFIEYALRRHSSKFIHAHWFLSGLAASRIRSKQTIITLHDVSLLHIPEQNERYTLYYAKALKRFKDLEIPIITVSENARKDAILYGGFDENLVFAVHNGINHEHFSFNPQAKKVPFRMVYAGGLGKRKRVDWVLKTFKVLKERFPEAHLLLAGAHPERTPYPKLAQELGLKDVEFLGFVKDEELPTFYQSAELLLFPSEYEGFGFTPLEAMACGTPVVTSTGGSLPEITGKAALHATSLDECIEQCSILFSKPSLREQLIQRGLKQAQTFTWKKTARKTIGVYNEIGFM